MSRKMSDHSKVDKTDLNYFPLPPRDKKLTVEELRQIFRGDWRVLAQIIDLKDLEKYSGRSEF